MPSLSPSFTSFPSIVCLRLRAYIIQHLLFIALSFSIYDTRFNLDYLLFYSFLKLIVSVLAGICICYTFCNLSVFVLMKGSFAVRKIHLNEALISRLLLMSQCFL